MEYIKKNYKAISITGFFALVLLVTLWFGLLYNKVVHCYDFKSQKDAQKALQNGATQLDRNKNNRACENLP